jgi:hypothetical protein
MNNKRKKKDKALHLPVETDRQIQILATLQSTVSMGMMLGKKI